MTPVAAAVPVQDAEPVRRGRAEQHGANPATGAAVARAVPPDITKLRVDPIPPQPTNVESEQRFLGAILLSPVELRRCAGIVSAEDFAWTMHQQIFEAIERLLETGITPNPVTLAPYFETGSQYLVKLVRCAVTVDNAIHYAYQIADFAIRRRIGLDLWHPEPGVDALDALQRHRDRLNALRRAKLRLARKNK